MEPEDDDDREEWYRMYEYPPAICSFQGRFWRSCWAAKQKQAVGGNLVFWEKRWFAIYKRFMLSFPSADETSKVISAHYLVGASISEVHGEEAAERPFVLRFASLYPKRPKYEMKPMLLSFQDEKSMKDWRDAINTVSNAPFTPAKFKKFSVGEPENTQHVLHVTADQQFGMQWLSEDVRRWLSKQGIGNDDIDAHARTVKSCVEITMHHKNPLSLKQKLKNLQHSAKQEEAFSLADLAEQMNPVSLFRSEKEVDAGSQGKVYRATVASPKVSASLAVGTDVAIKKVILRPSDPPEVEKALAAEIAFLKACSHPSIVDLHACYQHENEIWLVMEMMGGGKLTDLLDAGTVFKESEIATIMREVMQGIAYLHEDGCLHRDIKSDNVLLTTEGKVKLGDFGFAATVSGAYGNKRKTVVGTPYWMAPEVIQGESYDMKADIWSLGILLLELCDGQPPWMEYPPMKALFKIATSAPPTISSSHRFSPACHDFARQMLCKNQNERATAAELLKHPFLDASNCAADTSFLSEMIRQADV